MSRVGGTVVGLAGLVVLVVWASWIFVPQHQRLAALLDDASADAQSVARIDATLRQAGAIRKARADVIARLSGEDRTQKRSMEEMLRLLDRDARQRSVSIVAITPVQSAAGVATKHKVENNAPEFEIAVEGTFARTMRFVEMASESDASLEVVNVRLDAERREGGQQLLVAQIDVHASRFTMPR